jgi:flavin reductase (DIM6/NTAB) family NADH-FMN oxidoreductase RutF
MRPSHLALFEEAPAAEAGVDERHLRDALGRFATGVTVVTTLTEDGKLEGLTANSFSSVSLDPPLVLWSLRASAPSLASFEKAGHFAVNVLAASQRALCRHFATPSRNKFESVAHVPGLGGCPLLAGVLAVFECTTETHVAGGDHVIFFGRIRRATFVDGAPLIFSSGKYGTHAPLE